MSESLILFLKCDIVYMYKFKGDCKADINDMRDWEHRIDK